MLGVGLESIVVVMLLYVFGRERKSGGLIYAVARTCSSELQVNFHKRATSLSSNSFNSLKATIMALALRSQSAPQCLACLRRLAIPSYMNDAAPPKQQVRGKKKMVNNSDFLTVRLRKDVETFGRKGTSKNNTIPYL